MKARKATVFLTIIGMALLFFSCKKEQAKPETAQNTFLEGWELFSSQNNTQGGEEISTEGFKPDQAYDIHLPATVMAALQREKEYGDIFFGDNLNGIPADRFDVPWWYRKVFTVEGDRSKRFYNLKFEGLNYKANIWLNGEQIAASTEVEGCFRMFEFNVTDKLKSGKNVLAVELIPPEWGDLTIGFVDWNPWPADDNMGIWRPVKLMETGAVRIKSIFVKSSLDTSHLDKASLALVCTLENLSDMACTGTLDIEIEGRTISHPVKLNAGQISEFSLTEETYPELLIRNPRLWWPNNMGKPELYMLEAQLRHEGLISDSFSTRFGIRRIDDYFNEEGHRGYRINGKEILIKGGGWVDDIFLDDSDEKVEDQIRYVKHMNLNTIRLEGFWGKNKKIYDYADEHGILVMIGWSCQWEWKDYCGREEDEYLAIKSEKEIAEHTQAYKDQVQWLRNHPSVFLWVYGSDKLLIPEFEESMNSMIRAEDGTRPILNSCGGRISTVTGKSGVKMNGPYSYVTPNYWYLDDSRGGAFGFNTETGPGLQLAPLESIRRMIPEKNLWPLDSIWAFHLGRREFASFENWIDPFRARYGMDDNVEDFSYKAQMASYEAMRAMFEAFHVNRPNTTGIIQWMLNSAWPAMIWQLYDYYLMPNAAFYATRNACREMNIVYNYKDDGIYITDQDGMVPGSLTAEIKLFAPDGELLNSETIAVDSMDSYSTRIYTVPDSIERPDTYFLDLRLLDGSGELKAVNFYWLSSREDVLDFENSKWYVTGNSSYADLKGINTMPKAQLETQFEKEIKGDTVWVNAEITNNSEQIAFFIELSLKDVDSDASILPVFWEDNYISLLPNEKRAVKAYFLEETGKFDIDTLVPSVKAWNVGE